MSNRQPIDYSISYAEFDKLVKQYYEQSVERYRVDMLEGGEEHSEEVIRSHVEEYMMGHISQIVDDSNEEQL